MKNLILIILLSCPLILIAQKQTDSHAKHMIDSLIQNSRKLTDKLEFETALGKLTQAESIALELFGSESESYGSICHNRGRVYDFKGNFQQAELWYQKGKEIRKNILGTEHPDYAWSLNNLAYIYQEIGDFEKAESHIIEAKNIREKILGKEHPDYSASLNNLAILYWKLGKYTEAEQLYLESKFIREKTLGKNNPEYVKCLINLGALYSSMSRYEEAESNQLEALNIQEKAKGYIYSDYALTLNNLSGLYTRMGFLEKSLSFAIRANEIDLILLGKEHPDCARSLGTIANCYLEMDNFKESEKYYLLQLAIEEKLYGNNHPNIASTVSNLAVLYSQLSNYKKSETYHLRAKSIRETTLGKEHPAYCESLNNLGVLYWKIKQYEKAEAFYMEAEAIRKKVLGEKHEDYAGVLNNLGSLYGDMGNYEKAELFLLKSIKLKEKYLGKTHPLYSNSLNNLADLYQRKGEYEKAESFTIEAIKLREQIYGKNNSLYLESLFLLATIYEYQKRYGESYALFEDYFQQTQSLKAKACSYLSEQELNFFVKQFKSDIHLISSFQCTRSAKNITYNSLPSLIYNQMLFQKGFLLSAAKRINLLTNTTAESKELFSKLKALRRRLSIEYEKPIANQKFVKELEEKSNSVEKKLVLSLEGYSIEAHLPEWKELRDSLKKGEAAIEFLHFPVIAPFLSDSIVYAALLIKPGIQEPVFIPLFEEKSLDSLLNSKEERRLDYVNKMYSLNQRGAIPIEQNQGSLKKLMYDPLKPYLENIHTLYYSLSGLMHRINLSAIAINTDEIFSDKYRLVELLSSRQVLKRTSSKIKNSMAVLYGGVQYYVEDKADSNRIDSSTLVSATLAIRQADLKKRDGPWTYIPGSLKEVEQISRIMSGNGMINKIKTGFEASEEYFKTIDGHLGSSQIIHLATHGYFFEDPLDERFNRIRTIPNENVYSTTENPMLRSGLIMARGNVGWNVEQFPDTTENGILTAYEISQLNLSNTELVVLSACETGLGDIQGNEGVYGLQRAFKIAGVKFILMSLWQVPDKQTSLLMIRFYKRWLEDKMNIRQAFYTAQKEMRELGFDPYQWAGFVLIE